MEHRLLLHNIQRDSAAASGTPTATGGDGGTRTGDVSTTSNNNNIDTNMVIVLAVLLCALICALALNSIVRCALRCSTRLATSPPDHQHVTAAIRLRSNGAGATRGLKRSSLRQIPIAIYSPAGGGTTSMNIRTTDCIICLGEFVDGEKIRVLPKCNHGFHVPCIDAWLLCHSSCPTCRQSLVAIDQSASSSNSEDGEAAARSGSSSNRGNYNGGEAGGHMMIGHAAVVAVDQPN